MPDSWKEYLRGLETRSNVRHLDMAQLQREARPYGRDTAQGSANFISNVRNRSAGVTVYLGSDDIKLEGLGERQKAILAAADSTLEEVKAYLQKAPLVCVKRNVGANSSFNPNCTLYLSTQRANNLQQAYLWASTLTDFNPNLPGPELFLVSIPEWPENERQVLAMPEEGVTFVLSSDYVGEAKMGFLRMGMWEAKRQGMLSLHAGSKMVRARDKSGQLKRYGMIFFGLSGTGKTTHSCHAHGLTQEGEEISILQDDVVFLGKDGSALGAEQGLYLKTEGVGLEYQPIVYNALMSPETLFENVYLDHAGDVDFGNLILGGNGRAVIPRSSMSPHITEDINLPPLNELDGLIVAFITRRMTVLPILSKLTPEQAAQAYMLGESIETSAGDPRRAGESVRVVGTNPFIVGDETDEGNWFYDFLKRNEEKVQCYLLNTGGIGEIRERDAEGRSVVKQNTLRVEIPEMASLIRGIVRNTIEWEEEPLFGTQTPRKAEGVDMDKFRPERYYSKDQIATLADSLKKERREWLGCFPGLDEKIKTLQG